MDVTAIGHLGPSPTPSGAKTAVSRAQMKSSTSQSQSPSYIPLLSPKSARKPGPTLITSSLPSSLSAPHLGLVPPKRTPSGSSPSLPQQSLQQQQQQQAAVHPPQLPHPPSSPQASGGGGTSLPSLRALRSFLPFGGGSGKSAFASNAAVPGSLKSPFAGFASGRRTSITVERKNSGQFSRPGGDDIIDVAVIAISPPTSSKANTEHTRDITHSADAQAQSLPSASASHAELAPPVVTFNPGPPLSTELSTILESDLSGLSKHLPALDESRSSDVSGSGHSNKPEAPPPSPQINELVALDASVLDLSTSQLKEEVMHALKEKTSRNGWLSGVVVEDVPDSRPPSREMLEANAAEEPEESFHLDALDPDLVALLSANRIRAKQPIFQTEIPFASTLTPQQPQPIVPPRIFPPSRAVTPQSRPSPLGHSPVDVSPSSATGSARSQPSPVRANAPHAHPSLARSAPTRFVPRLMRSVTDRAVSTRGDRNVENAARAPSDSALPLDDARRISSDSLYLRRPPVSPLHLPLEFQPPPPPIQHTNTEPLRRVAPSRLATPARFGMNGSATSRLLRSALPSSSTLPSAWGGDSPSPTSRASSAIGTAADRLIRPRTSEDGALEGRPSARELLGYAPRNRNRSFSVGGGNTERATSPAPRPTEWLGPRTAKAFAAAGLLDRDANGGASRFGSVRSLGDRDQRPLAPSRLAASEAGSAASSWQSGSVSRAMTHSEATGHDSASTSTGAPRTTRSADSTAPTSISMSRPQSRTPSPQHKNYQAVLQAMVEKHATETGTLLAALADAQHNAQSLRAENGRLKERVEDLEAELVDARVQLRTHQCAGGSAVAPPHSSAHLQPPARAVLGWTEREASADAALVTSRRRPMPTLPLSASGPGGSRVVVDLKRMRDADDENATYQGGRFAPSRRASGGADSVFAVPPPNMSMLLQEQPAGSRRSGSSCVSMTTVSAPTDVDAPGSPRSLFLRPEHESHLGDLGSLDMRFTEDEGDDDAAGFDME